MTNALMLSLASIACVTIWDHPVLLHTNHATPSSAWFQRTTGMLNPAEELTHTGSAPSREPSNIATNALVAQHLKRRDRMLCFLFLFLYIQCPLQGLNSSTTHVRTGKFPYCGKAPSGISHSFYICCMGASLLDLPHFFIIPTSCYSPSCLPVPAPMAYL